MFKIAVCDDEEYFRDSISQLLKTYMEKEKISYKIDCFSSGEEFVCLGMEVINYNVLFLDINMEQLDGMKTAEKIRQISSDIFIVFVTAFASFAFEGYKVDAIRYILKNNSNYTEAIYECMDAIFTKLNGMVKKKTFHFIEGMKTVPLDKILYVESRLHKLIFYIEEEEIEKYTSYNTLNELEKELNSRDFLRIHQSFLVNMKYIKKITRYKVLLKKDIWLDVPRARYKYVSESYTAYRGEL